MIFSQYSLYLFIMKFPSVVIFLLLLLLLVIITRNLFSAQQEGLIGYNNGTPENLSGTTGKNRKHEIPLYKADHEVYKIYDNVYFDQAAKGELIVLDGSANDTNIKKLTVLKRDGESVSYSINNQAGKPKYTSSNNYIDPTYQYFSYDTATVDNTDRYKIFYCPFGPNTIVMMHNGIEMVANAFIDTTGCTDISTNNLSTIGTSPTAASDINTNVTNANAIHTGLGGKNLYKVWNNAYYDLSNGNIYEISGNTGVDTEVDTHNRDDNQILVSTKTRDYSNMSTLTSDWIELADTNAYILYVRIALKTMIMVMGKRSTETVLLNKVSFNEDVKNIEPDQTSSTASSGTDETPNNNDADNNERMNDLFRNNRSSTAAEESDEEETSDAYGGPWENPDDYIRKTQIVPPVCPACPACPKIDLSGICTNCGGNGGAGAMGSVTGTAAGLARDAGSGATNLARDAGSGATNLARDTASGAAGFAKETAGGAVGLAKDTVGGTVGLARDTVGGTVGLARETAGGVGGMLKSAGSGIAGIFSSGAGMGQGTSQGMGQRMGQGMGQGAGYNTGVAMPQHSISTRTGTDQNAPIDPYSYYGQLPYKGATNVVPITADFSSFAK
jgi:hypothetical protein